MQDASPGAIDFDDCCRTILEGWRGRRDSAPPELRDYQRQLLSLLTKEFGISWDDRWVETLDDRSLPVLIRTMPRAYAGLVGPFAAWLEICPLPGEPEVWHRHTTDLEAAEVALKQHWVALFRDLLLLRWPEAAHRRTSWLRLRQLGLGDPVDELDVL